MFGQSFGPVLGGAFAQYLGFRSIFWFLFIAGGLAIFLIIAFLPETLARIAGNGSVRLHGLNRPIFYKSSQWTVEYPVSKAPKMSIHDIIEPLKFLLEKDVFVTLLFGSVVYAFWSMVTTSTTSIFLFNYHYKEAIVGLMFLPNGLGCVLGSYVTGHIMDYDFRRVEAQVLAAAPLELGAPISKEAFPLERARLQSMPWLMAIFIAALAG